MGYGSKARYRRHGSDLTSRPSTPGPCCRPQKLALENEARALENERRKIELAAAAREVTGAPACSLHRAAPAKSGAGLGPANDHEKKSPGGKCELLPIDSARARAAQARRPDPGQCFHVGEPGQHAVLRKGKVKPHPARLRQMPATI